MSKTPVKINAFLALSEKQISELMNIWHLSKCAIGSKRHARMIWTAKCFHKENDNVGSRTNVYKNLDRQLEGW